MDSTRGCAVGWCWWGAIVVVVGVVIGETGAVAAERDEGAGRDDGTAGREDETAGREDLAEVDLMGAVEPEGAERMLDGPAAMLERTPVDKGNVALSEPLAETEAEAPLVVYTLRALTLQYASLNAVGLFWT